MKKSRVIGIGIAVILVSFILLYIYNSFKTLTLIPPFFTSKVEKNLSFVDNGLDYLYYRDTEKATELHKAKIDGSQDVLISANVGYKYNYSPDFTKIVFIEKDLNNKKTVLKALNIETDEVIYEAVLDTTDVDLPRFSPNSKSLLYSTGAWKDEQSSIFIIDVDKKTNTEICKVPAKLKIGNAIWAKDGNGFWVQYFYLTTHTTEYQKYDLKKKAFTVKTTREGDMDVVSSKGVDTYGLFTELPFETVQLDNHNNFALKLKADGRELIKFNSGIGQENVKSITDYDFTPDFKYMIFQFNHRVYALDVASGKIGKLPCGLGNYCYELRFLGQNHFPGFKTKQRESVFD